MKVINISQIRKAAEQNEYLKELDKREKHKQKMIEIVINRLNTVEIDTATMALLDDINALLATSWSIGNLKRKYEKNVSIHREMAIK